MRLASFMAVAALTLFTCEFAVGQSILTQIEKGLQKASPPPAGSAPSTAAPSASAGYLGAALDDENEMGKGIRVTNVRPDGPAAAGGLKEEDLITAINGKAVKSVDDYDTANGPPGTKLEMTVERRGNRQFITVTLGARPPSAAEQPPGGTAAPSLAPATTSPVAPGPAGASPAPSAGAPSLLPPAGATTPSTLPGGSDASARGSITRPNPLDLPPPPPTEVPSAGAGVFPSTSASSSRGASLGISVESLTEQTRGASTVPVRRGAIITAIKPGSPAEAAGLPLSAVIVSVDGKIVDSSDDLVSAIRAARPGQEIELTYYEGRNLNRKSIRLAAASGAVAATPPPSSGGLFAPGGTAPSGAPPSSRGGSSALPGSGSAAAPAVDIPPRTAPGGPGPLGGGMNRPLLQRIERGSDNLARPAATSTVYDPLVMAELQSRVADMAAQMIALEDRLKAIESKLGVSAPATPGRGSPSPPASGPGLGTPSGTGTNP